MELSELLSNHDWFLNIGLVKWGEFFSVVEITLDGSVTNKELAIHFLWF